MLKIKCIVIYIEVLLFQELYCPGLTPLNSTFIRQLTPGMSPAIARTTVSNGSDNKCSCFVVWRVTAFNDTFKRNLILGVNMLATQSIPDALDSATSLGLVFAGILFLLGLLTGIWKFQQMMASKDGLAHRYVDIAHRARADL